MDLSNFEDLQKIKLKKKRKGKKEVRFIIKIMKKAHKEKLKSVRNRKILRKKKIYNPNKFCIISFLALQKYHVENIVDLPFDAQFFQQKFREIFIHLFVSYYYYQDINISNIFMKCRCHECRLTLK
ncbi:hypothetical protein V1477_011456 [Vespula maculifrons]|uniref:Uncharacterized protein n=1 Tax=Vespula maculifrons TaxID=7453 RepID=A0ABD2BZ98_VESMC